MTTLQLNAELLRELSIIAEDEGMLKKVLTFVKTLTPAKKTKVVASTKKPYKTIPVSSDIRKWSGCASFTEDEIESAKRELLEEVGVNADSDKVSFTALGTYCLPSSNGKYVYAYLYYAVADVITVRQISEVSGVMFIEESEILRLQESCTKDSVTAFKEIVSRAKEKGIY